MVYINTRNADSAAGIPKSLTETIIFLTRPLIMFYTPSEISTAQTVLQTKLTTAYFGSYDRCIYMTLSPMVQPPRPFLAACAAAGVDWAAWIIALGGKELDVFIEPLRAVIRFGGRNGTTTTIWQEPKVYRPPHLRIQVPSSLPEERPSQASLRATVDSAIARAQGRTKAQELLESNDKEEADEIFALLSTVTGITPTPTRDHFQLDELSPVSSPASSRPSSRSSTLSHFSRNSSASSADSMTSSSTALSGPNSQVPTNSDIYPEDVPEQECTDESNIYVDKSKKSVQKFLYQGGVSTILTGGVMLGAAMKTTRSPRNEGFEKSQTPFGRQRSAPVNGKWRRF